MSARIAQLEYWQEQRRQHLQRLQAFIEAEDVRIANLQAQPTPGRRLRAVS